MPGYTCYSVAASVVNAGLKIRLYDVDPHTFAPEMNSLNEGLNDKTLAVLVQHLFGIPVRMDEIRSSVSRKGVWLIEDAAQGLGGSIAGRHLGASGDFGLFSFGRGKPLPLGSGGALAGAHTDTLRDISMLAAGNGHIQVIKSAIVRMLSSPLIYGLVEKAPLGIGKTEFDPDIRLAQMPAEVKSLGALTLGYITELNRHRRMAAAIYSLQLPSALIPIPESSVPVFTRFPVMAGSIEISPELKRLGVRRMYPQSIADVPEIKQHLCCENENVPGSRLIAKNLITLPTHMNISSVLAYTIALKVKEAYSC
jgi:dTDP-4-amino-4,6-dideoxygalactose transaminase